MKNNINSLLGNAKKILWDEIEFFFDKKVFYPKDSTIGIINEVEESLNYFSQPIPIYDICCGIGNIGIACMLKFPNSFNHYFGFDNNLYSVKVCNMNIFHHEIKGNAEYWEAGNKLPSKVKGVVVCNPPFLSFNKEKVFSEINNPFEYANHEGLEVLLKCFQSLINTKHIMILKCLKHQVPQIIGAVKSNFKLTRQTNKVIDNDYTVAFTTWENI